MRITLFHNPKAGSAEHDKKELLEALAKAGHSVVYQSTKKGDWKKALKEPADLVLAAGGDGTIGKVATYLVGSGVPLAVLPLGTANNLARTLGFDATPEQIIARLEGGTKHAVDVGFASGPYGERYFFEGAGGGLLADYVGVAKKPGKNLKQLSREQEMTRHVSGLRGLLHDYPARDWEIEIDGEDMSDRYLLWEAMNIQSVGPVLY